MVDGPSACEVRARWQIEGEPLAPFLDICPPALADRDGRIGQQIWPVLAAALAGWAALPLNVVVVTGPDVDPATLGPQPSNVLVEWYLPHGPLFARAERRGAALSLLPGAVTAEAVTGAARRPLEEPPLRSSRPSHQGRDHVDATR